MRVAVDLGPLQADLSRVISWLGCLARLGGATLDLRVAVDASDPAGAGVLGELVSGGVPRSAVSVYCLPSALPSADVVALTDLRLELRRRHVESLIPDIVLVPRREGCGWPTYGVPTLPIGDTPHDDGTETAEQVLRALKECRSAAVPLPDGEAALPILADCLVRGARIDPAEVVDGLIGCARLGEEPGPPRLLVDVSYIRRVDHGTGIQRVVRRISDGLMTAGRGRRHASVHLVAFDGTSFSVLDSIDGEPRGPLSIHTGDTLLMLDSSWEVFDEFLPVFERVRQFGGRVITVVYDLVPLLHPAVTSAALPPIFDKWFQQVVAQSDGLVCISRAVCDEVSDYLSIRRLPYQDGVLIGWWHLGADLPVPPLVEPSQDELSQFLEGPGPTMLMVGTIEPRKRHAVALNAMELLWAEGREVRLVILGREGWNVSAFAERLRNHPERGRRLLWLNEVYDGDITKAYSSAAALVFPSQSEGFGLPVVEAARAGLGSICSDIPVLREIGRDGVIYVPQDNSTALACAISEVAEGSRALAPHHVKAISWQESAHELLEVLDYDRWEHRLRRRDWT